MSRTKFDNLQIGSEAVKPTNLGNGAKIGTGIQPYSAELASLGSIVDTGLIVRTGNATHEAAIILGTTGRITVTDGDAVANNPTIDLSTLSDSGTGSFLKVSRDVYGRVSGTASVTSTDITTALGFTPENSANKGATNGYAPLVSGIVPSQYLPAIAITDTFVVANQTSMLALDAQTGDVAVRSDLNKSFILKGSSPSVLANWQELLTPTDSVLSVNGATGSVVLTTSDITEGTRLYYTDTRVRSAVSANGNGISYNSTSGQFSLDADLAAISVLSDVGTGFLKKTAQNTWSLDTNTYLTGNQSITVSGDASGTGTTAISLTLATVGTPVTSSFVKITTDTKGRVSGTASVGSSDITTALGYTPQTQNATLTSLASNATTGILAYTAANTITARTITGTAGRITLTNGNGVAGNPTIDLATLTDGGTGTFQKITRDTYGRVSGTTAVTSTDITTALGYTPQTQNATLTSLAANATTGILAYTAANTITARTIAGTTNYITLTNGDGVSGNPTINIGSNVATTDTTQTISGAKTFSSQILSNVTTGTAPLSVASTTKVTNLNADLLDGLDSTAFQASDAELTAVAGLTTNGLIVKTGTGAATTRTITGTTDTISVTNGDGISNNPVITIADNPVIPGNGSLTFPVGTQVQRPASPTFGMIRGNSDASGLEAYVNGSWQGFVLNSQDLAAIQVRRTTTLTLSTTITAVTFNTVDYANQTSVITRDGTTTSRINIGEDGLYIITFSLEDIQTSNTVTDVYALRVNGTTTIPGSTATTSTRSSRMEVSRTVIYPLAAGNYFELVASNSTGTTGTLQIGAVITAARLKGVKGDAGPAGGTSSIYYPAATFDNPNNANWTINALAPVVADTANNALSVRAFDDTAEEGVGFTVYVPPSASNIVFTLTLKPATTPASAVGAILRFYSRAINIGSAVGAWSAATVLNTVSIPTNNYYQTFSQSLVLNTYGLVAGTTYQFELTRYGASASDTLVGDLHLLNATVSFT